MSEAAEQLAGNEENSNETLVTAYEDEASGKLPYILLDDTQVIPARTGSNYCQLGEWHQVESALASAMQSHVVAVDFETTGLEWDVPGKIDIQGIGLAWDTGSIYFHWPELGTNLRGLIGEFLLSHPGLVAHNIYFDGGIIYSKLGQHPKWLACTKALLSMLANESPERRTGLKDAQVDLLGWDAKGDVRLVKWLCAAGYYKGNRLKNNSPKVLLRRLRDGKLKPDRGQMWRAPKHILGMYCALDAESTYLLYTRILVPAVQQYPGLVDFFYQDFMHLIEVLIEQKYFGISIDREGMMARSKDIIETVNVHEKQFKSQPGVAEYIAEIEDVVLIQPVRDSEPPKHKKDGKISKNWINWKAKLDRAEARADEGFQFNIGSGPQMRKLLYEKLQFPARILTDSGLPGVGVKALKHMGEVGKPLVERGYLEKEASYLDKYIALTEHRDTLHPSFKTPGPITGRLSSSEPNMQQIPKSKAVMSLFRAKPGKLWVDLDFSALEPTVATEFSRDPNMELIYGNGRPNNDVYLFVMAHIPGMAEKVRGVGYDPYEPTPESLARAKKECKHERGICKTVVLACQYGAGVDKVMATLEEQDIFLAREEVEKVHKGYWELFARLKQYGWDLQREWKRNGGFILNGMNRPMAVPEDYKKDMLNRFVQSTGHDILVKYIRILCAELTKRQIPWIPLIIDFHDASAVEIDEGYLDETIKVYNWSVDELNRQLGGRITLKGVPSFGTTLSDIKEPEE